MKEINKIIGENIRKIRKAQNTTIMDMADAIHKGKSTVSKYETGEISIDAETLFEIADFLSVSPSSLISVPKKEEARSSLSPTFINKYVYFYDGRVKKIICGVLEEYSSDEKGNKDVLMYFDIKNEKDYKSCLSFYKGSCTDNQLVSNYSMINMNNSAERVWFCCLNNLRNENIRLGVISGLSYKTMLPVSIKAIISDMPLSNEKNLEEMLFLSKDDIKLIKKNNMFTLNERI